MSGIRRHQAAPRGISVLQWMLQLQAAVATEVAAR
jgi:hypothetical protein